MGDAGDYLARALAFVSGAILFFFTFLLYQPEENKIRSRIEDWWVLVDDIQRSAVSRLTAFILVIMTVATRLLSSFFGQRLYSWRAFSTSLCLSGALIFLMAAAVEIFVRSVVFGYHFSVVVRSLDFVAIGTVALAAVALSPALSWAPTLGLLFLLSTFSPLRIVMGPGLPTWRLSTTTPSAHYVKVALLLLAGAVVVHVLVSLGRWAVRPRSSAVVSVLRAVAAASMPVVLAVGPIILARITGFRLTGLSSQMAAMLLTAFVIPAIPGLVLVCLGLLMLVYRACLPLFGRVVYSLAHNYVAAKSMLAVISFLLVAFALLPRPDWWDIVMRTLKLK